MKPRLPRKDGVCPKIGRLAGRARAIYGVAFPSTGAGTTLLHGRLREPTEPILGRVSQEVKFSFEPPRDERWSVRNHNSYVCVLDRFRLPHEDPKMTTPHRRPFARRNRFGFAFTLHLEPHIPIDADTACVSPKPDNSARHPNVLDGDRAVVRYDERSRKWLSCFQGILSEDGDLRKKRVDPRCKTDKHGNRAHRCPSARGGWYKT
jgi:hypothetical protein